MLQFKKYEDIDLRLKWKKAEWIPKYFEGGQSAGYIEDVQSGFIGYNLQFLY